MVRAFRNEETVQLGDEHFTLAIDLTTIDAIEDEFDLPFDDVMKQFSGNVRIGKLARLLRGLLKRHHPELSLDDIGGLIMADMGAFADGMERLFEKVRPEPSKAKGQNPPKAHRGTGTSSSSRGARPVSRRRSSGTKRLAHSS